MDKALAQQFADRRREYGNWFNEMTELSSRLDDIELSKAVRRALAEGLMAIEDTLFRKLRREHPELFDQ